MEDDRLVKKVYEEVVAKDQGGVQGKDGMRTFSRK